MSLLTKVIEFWAPLSALPRIASELSTIRELIELELASRHPPIVRITEAPGPSDTEIFYSSEPPARKKSTDLWPDSDIMEEEEDVSET